MTGLRPLSVILAIHAPFPGTLDIHIFRPLLMLPVSYLNLITLTPRVEHSYIYQPKRNIVNHPQSV